MLEEEFEAFSNQGCPSFRGYTADSQCESMERYLWMKLEFEVVKNTKGKAIIWRQFGLKKNHKTNIIEQNVAVCLACKKVISHMA